MDKERLVQTARALVAEKKGILAADESGGTIKRRFDTINVESTEENRRNYREMLFRTAGVADFVSGVILFDETIRQAGADGTPLVRVLSDQGIIPGIKVDKGTVPLPSAPDELVTEGLDGLRDRLTAYVELGAGFTTWRAVISISAGSPPSDADLGDCISGSRRSTPAQKWRSPLPVNTTTRTSRSSRACCQAAGSSSRSILKVSEFACLGRSSVMTATWSIFS